MTPHPSTPHPVAPGASAPWEALPASFAAWWWQPRQRLPTPPHGPSAAASLLARRSAAHGSAADEAAGFGAAPAWHWAGLALLSPPRRLLCARLYAAVLMPQAPMLAGRLGRLGADDRRWALAIGSIQPVPRRLDWAAFETHDDAVLAYAELGFWVRDGFAPLWERLLHDLDEPTRRAVEVLMAGPQPTRAKAWPAGMAGRVRRCWSLAQARAMELEGHSDGLCDEHAEHLFCQRDAEPA